MFKINFLFEWQIIKRHFILNIHVGCYISYKLLILTIDFVGWNTLA